MSRARRWTSWSSSMKVGDKIRIVRMVNEPEYDGKEGIIRTIGKDCDGDEYLRGTWGGLSVYPKIDEIEIINN